MRDADTLAAAGPGRGAGRPSGLYVGTSGFAYREWKGSFYPEGLRDPEMLAHYATLLPSVEVNYTFRRMPSESLLHRWREQAPPGFRLSLKAPQRITHTKRLDGVGEEVDELIRRSRILGDRLGAILFQLPPTLRLDRRRLETFLAALPPVARYAVEFRHDSWDAREVDDLLGEHGVARCVADTDAAPAGELRPAASHVYLRLRRERYEPGEVAAWARRAAGEVAAGREVYCYFKHEAGDAGPGYALRLLAAAGSGGTDPPGA